MNSEASPAMFAAFSIDAKEAAKLLTGGEVHPVRLPNGRGVLIVTVIDYRTTDIGAYIEFSIAIACTQGRRPAPRVLPALFRKSFGTGQFVVDLPVSTEISVKGGKGIWGMPKHQANLDFVISDKQVSSQYDKDGLLAMRIEVDRTPLLKLPIRTSAANYCAFRGMLMKSYIYFRGPIEIAIGRRASARLYVGDSPRVAALRNLDISTKAIFTGFLHTSDGLLDDYGEFWFLTSDSPPSDRPEGLESVVDLGLSQEWLDPPKAEYR